MANRRRRRPEQDEGRKDRKDFRQRAEVSRTQRSRIETQRDRRERKREIRRSRRQQVDSVRSPKEDLRTERFDSRLLPVEDSFLARPVGAPHELPVLIGERWTLTTPNQSVADGVDETLIFNTASFTTERNGYPAIYNATTGIWRIPAGLSGIWSISVSLSYANDATGDRNVYIDVGATTIAMNFFRASIDVPILMTVGTVYNFQEGDEFLVRVGHTAGAALDVIANAEKTWAFAHFLGK